MQPDGVLESGGNGYTFRYKLNQDGSIGVDYFDYSGNPINNNEWGGTIDPQQIEYGAHLGYRSYDEYLLDNGGTTSTGQTDPSNPEPTAPPSPAGGTTGGETAAPAYRQVYNQVEYTTPEAYKAAVDSDILAQHDETKKKIDNMYDRGLITLDEKETAIAENRRQLKTSRDEALADQAGFFSSVSPQALQSQQGTYANKVQTDYQNTEKQLGPEMSFRNLTPEQVAQYANTPNLGASGQIVRGFADLGQQRADLIAEAGRNKMSNLDATANNLITAKEQLKSTAVADYAPDIQTAVNAYLSNYLGGLNSNKTGAPAIVGKNEDEYSDITTPRTGGGGW